MAPVEPKVPTQQGEQPLRKEFENADLYGALLIAVGQVMKSQKISAPAAMSGPYDELLVTNMIAEGVSIMGAQEALDNIELSDVATSS